MSDRKPIIAGNWKMHHDHFAAIQFIQKLSYLLDTKDYDRVRRRPVPAVHRPALRADHDRERPHPDVARRAELSLGGPRRLHR